MVHTARALPRFLQIRTLDDVQLRGRTALAHRKHMDLRRVRGIVAHAAHVHHTGQDLLGAGEIDRFYFRSLYFREPSGILFEIATDGPGFATDEPLATLGEKLALPPFLEPRRNEIEAGLKPIE